MSTKTSSQLSIEVLRSLGVIAADETPDALDSTYVTGVYQDKYEELTDLELTYWSVNDIPGPLFITLKDLVINEVRGAFGETQNPEDKEARDKVILQKVRRHMRKHSSALPVTADHF